MTRQIFTVDAHIVDANGNFAYLQDYPKKFDSANYQNDIDKTKKRAEGDLSEVWGAMCKRDDRLIQVVTLTDVFGNQIDRKSMGDFPAEPEPEQAE